MIYNKNIYIDMTDVCDDKRIRLFNKLRKLGYLWRSEYIHEPDYRVDGVLFLESTTQGIYLHKEGWMMIKHDAFSFDFVEITYNIRPEERTNANEFLKRITPFKFI